MIQISENRQGKYWYLLLLLGVIFIGTGIWVFLTPGTSYIALSLLFTITFLISGILEIIYAVSNRKILHNWGWSLAGGILGLLIGILLAARPEISMVVLPFYVGFAILFRSILAVIWSVDLKKLGLPDWGYLMAIGIIGVVLAFIMLWNPLFAGLTLVFYTAFAFIMAGIFQVYLAIRLKQWRNSAE